MQALLARAGALGDLLLLRPTIAALRASGHRVNLLAPEAGAALVGAGPSEVDQLLPWDGPELAQRLAGEVTSGPLDAALREADLVIAFTRSEVVGEALRPRKGRLLLHDPSPPAGFHVASWLTESIAPLGMRPRTDPRLFCPPSLHFSGAERAAAARLLPLPPCSFFAFHPGSGSAAKCWPVDRFRVLATRLAAQEPFLLVLGPAEQGQVWEDMPRAIVARELPSRTLGTLLSCARLFVGNDSGVSHLAAACGAPTLALFGPTDPAVWGPLGRHAGWLRASDRTLAGLTVDEVAAEAASLLAHVSGERTSTRLIRR